MNLLSTLLFAVLATSQICEDPLHEPCNQCVTDCSQECMPAFECEASPEDQEDVHFPSSKKGNETGYGYGYANGGNGYGYGYGSGSHEHHAAPMWLVYAGLTMVAIMSLGFEKIFHYVEHHFEHDLGHHHEDGHAQISESDYDPKYLPLLQWSNFKNEVTILGCAAMTIFFLERFYFWDFLADNVIVWDDCIDGVTIFHTMENIHYAVFLAMCFHMTKTRIFSTMVKKRIEVIKLFSDDSEGGGNEQLKATHPQLHLLLTNAEITLQEFYRVILKGKDQIDISDYLSMKLVDSVGDLLQFDELSWITITIGSASCSGLMLFLWLLEYDSEEYQCGDEEHQVTGILILCLPYLVVLWMFSVLLMYHFQMLKYKEPLKITENETALSDHGPEDRRNSMQQAAMFYVCYHVSIKLLRFTDNYEIEPEERFTFFLDLGLFVAFCYVYPWQLSKYFHVVLALPPFFDVDDLQYLEMSKEGAAAERHAQKGERDAHKEKMRIEKQEQMEMIKAKYASKDEPEKVGEDSATSSGEA